MNAEQEAAARRFDTVLQFAELHTRGLSFETNGNYLRLIPKGRATESDLRWATANKAELLELLGWLTRGAWREATLPAEPTKLTKLTLEAEQDASGFTPRAATVELLAAARASGLLGGDE